MPGEPVILWRKLPPVYCAPCSGLAKMCVVHTGPPCKLGAEAFKPSTKEYAEALKSLDCQHEKIHHEGSLGWFCNKCGVPVEDSEEYHDG